MGKIIENLSNTIGLPTPIILYIIFGVLFVLLIAFFVFIFKRHSLYMSIISTRGLSDETTRCIISYIRPKVLMIKKGKEKYIYRKCRVLYDNLDGMSSIDIYAFDNNGNLQVGDMIEVPYIINDKDMVILANRTRNADIDAIEKDKKDKKEEKRKLKEESRQNKKKDKKNKKVVKQEEEKNEESLDILTEDKNKDNNDKENDNLLNIDKNNEKIDNNDKLNDNKEEIKNEKEVIVKNLQEDISELETKKVIDVEVDLEEDVEIKEKEVEDNTNGTQN